MAKNIYGRCSRRQKRNHTALSEMAIEILYLDNLLGNMRFTQSKQGQVCVDKTARIGWGNHINDIICRRHVQNI